MKTSNVLASALFGSLAIAAPLKARDYVTTTEVLVETVLVYTTVYDGEAPSTVAAEATSEAGLYYEQPASSIAAKTTSVYTPPVVEEPSSVYTPSASTPASEPSSVAEPSSIYTPPPAPSSAAAPSSSEVYVAPSSAEAPAPAETSVPTESKATGEVYHGDITIYDNTGAAGACGLPLTDTDMIVALAQPTWGESTYDVMTGEATNPWCGQKITISYNGNTVDAVIQDLCPGCVGQDIDLSLATWKALTGLDEKTRLQADWWKAE